MTIRDIANILVARHELTQADAEHFVQAVVEVINDGLLSDKQVKIKGFGTFKLQTIKERSIVSISTGEKVMISEHSKVTFTPDPIMKDLVNKPFTQFETVVIDDDSPLLDGNKDIDMDEELPDDTDEADAAPTINKTIAPTIAPTIDKTTATEPLPITPVNPLTDTPADTESEPLSDTDDDTPSANTNADDDAIKKTIPSADPENDCSPTDADAQEEGEDNRPTCRPTYRNILIYHNIAINIVIAAAFFTLGYMAKAEGWLNITPQTPVKTTPTAQTPPKHRPAKPQPKDTIAHKDTIAPAKTAEKAKAKESQEDMETKKAADQHAQMMQRYMANPITRTGAYNIIGVKEVAIAKKGQTLKDISKSYLGPGLESYVEVLNGFTEVKEGDEVLIPRLEMKKAARKKINK